MGNGLRCSRQAGPTHLHFQGPRARKRMDNHMPEAPLPAMETERWGRGVTFDGDLERGRA